ncbi:hypothetical protein ERO13_A01G213000v2 [Gossypium hirsutum]|uniref:ACT domain-containing protein ACR n=1 Tax=Gossypium hirsutum TaxID=3635 RepID=A0ABM3BVH1_GOSHI|nr:ACT domain-containing protein ACR10-like isoform X1 [Gossypium hirsutum]KAG4215987.1 hypothetical protein ERO13_A01G213000v2 [Gossypium hirsutum]KAG4215988.1 hypothetical protein ERO13_A01G213000v2 [Gossypium hirsutum]
MGILHDDVVIINQSKNEAEPSVITINCPDKTGLGCDLCRILLFFGLTIVRGDVSTDGKWCYIVLWVIPKPIIKWDTCRWELLKNRLIGTCPSCSSAFGISYYSSELPSSMVTDVFLIKLFCYDRKGLSHDITTVLCNLELNIKKVKVSTTPVGTVMNLFFVTDTRELLHTKMRQKETYEALVDVMQAAIISCNIEKVGPEVTACSQASPFLSSAITNDVVLCTSNNVSVTMDNSFSPAHTLVQIVCQDHKGLLYDIMRTLKDYNIQISYGRFYIKQGRKCEIDLFITQADGKKIIDPSMQRALSSRLQMELLRPLRVVVVSRGPDTELLVANPVELSSKRRPLGFHDITLALKMLNTCIFLAEIGRHVIGDQEWEVYRVLLDEGASLSTPRRKIEEGVWKLLMGWEQI